MNTVRFSRRTAWPSEANALTREVDWMRERGAPLLDGTLSNPTRAGLHFPAAVLSALGNEAALGYSPEPLGIAASRRTLARWASARGVTIDAERVALTASSSESYSHLLHLLADPGDEVLVPSPSYPLFSFLADLAGVKLRPYPLRYDGAWYIDLAALEAAISDRCRAIIAVSPNNPTGSYVKSDEALAMRQIAARHGLALISDEVFASYPLEGEAPPGLGAGDECLVFTLGGLSKEAGLPQMKLGWIFTSGPRAAVEGAMARLEMVADTYLSVGTPVQTALPAMLDAAAVVGDQIRARTRRNLAALRRGLAGSAATVLDVEGGWSAVLRLPATQPEEAWVFDLLRRGLLVYPGHYFDFEAEPFVVLSLLLPEGDLDAAVALLRGAVDG